ncbi:hypothetical protein ACFL0D_02145 [Thermoproteota archaeon]
MTFWLSRRLIQWKTRVKPANNKPDYKSEFPNLNTSKQADSNKWKEQAKQQASKKLEQPQAGNKRAEEL